MASLWSDGGMETAGKQPEGDELDAGPREGLRVLARLIARRLMLAETSANERSSAPADAPGGCGAETPATFPARHRQRRKGA
jgi:hypothetical protein